jgi:hypothetical protein
MSGVFAVGISRLVNKSTFCSLDGFVTILIILILGRLITMTIAKTPKDVTYVFICSDRIFSKNNFYEILYGIGYVIGASLLLLGTIWPFVLSNTPANYLVVIITCL